MKRIIGNKFKRIKTGFKTPGYVREQGVDPVQKRSVHEVREHFGPDRNAAIGHKMAF